MEHKKSIIIWGFLLILFLGMIFIEIKQDKNKDTSMTQDEVIYLSYDEEPLPHHEPRLESDALEPEPILDLPPIEVIPDLGRLAVTSVIINKKPSQVMTSVNTDPAFENTIQEPNMQFLQQRNEEVVPVSIAHQHQDLSYKIFQGHRFNAVLTHAIHSDLPGMVVAEISQDIYGYQSYMRLLPKGTRLIGSYNNRLTAGDTRLYIVWQRAITPEGLDIQLGSLGTDRLGQTGLTGAVDTHFWETFGTSSLLSVMAVGASNLSEDQGELSNQYQQGVTDALMDTSRTVLQGRIARKPTIHIAQGEIIHVVVAKDLDFGSVLKKAQHIPIF